MTKFSGSSSSLHHGFCSLFPRIVASSPRGTTLGTTVCRQITVPLYRGRVCRTAADLGPISPVHLPVSSVFLAFFLPCCLPPHYFMP
ncbi:hypothetical protein GW17_00026294 [Ensete ventricosum]|nr:hypothetical protein GW17_00026294 [Ensete ventricosum]